MDVNNITVDRSKYQNEHDFWDEVGNLIRILSNLGYTISARWDAGDKNLGIFVIEFDYEDPQLASRFNTWLTGEELDMVVANQANQND